MTQCPSFVQCTMERPAAIAVHIAYDGELHFYSIEALQKFLDAKFSVSTTRHALGDELHDNKFEGYTIRQWAEFARKKANIASSVAKLNGLLKASLAHSPDFSQKATNDIIFDEDPWRKQAVSQSHLLLQLPTHGLVGVTSSAPLQLLLLFGKCVL